MPSFYSCQPGNSRRHLLHPLTHTSLPRGVPEQKSSGSFLILHSHADTQLPEVSCVLPLFHCSRCNILSPLISPARICQASVFSNFCSSIEVRGESQHSQLAAHGTPPFMRAERSMLRWELKIQKIKTSASKIAVIKFTYYSLGPLFIKSSSVFSPFLLLCTIIN